MPPRSRRRGDPSHPELQALAANFAARVPAHREALVKILRDDRRERARAAAAYLLVYIHDGRELVRTLQSSMRDESSYVRNSVLRVLADIALHHPEVEIPLAPVLAALMEALHGERGRLQLARFWCAARGSLIVEG